MSAPILLTAKIDFNRDIRPILSENCFKCHGPDEKQRKGGSRKTGKLRLDIFEGDGDVIRFGEHRFSVNTQALDLTLLPLDEGLALHLTGSDFMQSIDDEGLDSFRDYWNQELPSETPDVYRAEYLAANLLFDAESAANDLSLQALLDVRHQEEDLLEIVRRYAQYSDVVLGSDWYADSAGLLEGLTEADSSLEPEWQIADEPMDFDVSDAVWRVYRNQHLVDLVADWCAAEGRPFFMRSSPALSHLRSSSRRTRLTRMLS